MAGLSLERKVRLLTGADSWTLPAEPAVGLRGLVLSDGPTGVRGTLRDERDPSLCLPSATALAATWDEELLAGAAGLLAAEARRKGVDVVLGPTVNLHRSPLGGRHFECYSEDPLLTARLGAAYVRALQALGVGACAKHYVANDSETERFTVDVRVGERALRELYLAPFEALVRAGVWMVMAAYNSVGGSTMTESPLLDEPLKGEWGFDGVVVSDWTAARRTVESARAGLDLVMPGPDGVWGDALVEAVRDGRVPEGAVDEKLRRLLLLAERVSAAPAPPAVDAPPLLRRLASTATVLCRNDGLLPLDRASLRRVAVLGPNAAQARIQGGGSAGVLPTYTVSPLDGLRAELEPEVELVHAAGAFVGEGLEPLRGLTVRARFLAADGSVLREEERRSAQLVWLGDPDLLRADSVELVGRFRAEEAGVHRLGVIGSGIHRLEAGGRVLLDEDVRPAEGTPPERFGEVELAAGEEVELRLVRRQRTPSRDAFVTLGVRRPRRAPDEELAAGVELARGADVAVVVVGTTEQVESEGFDRETIAVPGRQDELVRAVAAANPRTVVVVNAGAPVELPWRDEVAAVLICWFGGQELGNALADVLLGLAEPGGRLPTTWPAREEEVPVLSTRPGDGVLEYAEGIHVGYRAWLRAGRDPAYPFGHGLGYTRWEYESLQVAGGEARVRVRNTGARRGREVVQAYLSRPGSAVERPVRWLAGFAVVEADPGEAVEAAVRLEPRAFEHWDEGWRREPGAFELAVGRSVSDLRLRAEVPG